MSRDGECSRVQLTRNNQNQCKFLMRLLQPISEHMHLPNCRHSCVERPLPLLPLLPQTHTYLPNRRHSCVERPLSLRILRAVRVSLRLERRAHVPLGCRGARLEALVQGNHGVEPLAQAAGEGMPVLGLAGEGGKRKAPSILGLAGEREGRSDISIRIRFGLCFLFVHR